MHPSLFSFLLQRFLPLHYLHQLHLVDLLLQFYQLTKPCQYLSPLLLVDLNSAIHRRFPSLIMCGSMHPICVWFVLWKCVQAIVRWRSIIVRRFCAIRTLGRESNVGSTVVDVACLCRVASVPRLIVLSIAATKRSKKRTICRRLAVFRRAAVTWNWSVACPLTSSI